MLENIKKSLVNKRFSKACKHYRENAIVQKEMAKTLTDALLSHIQQSLPLANRPLSMLEIGCGTGFVTEQVLARIAIKQFIANDLYLLSDDYIAPLVEPLNNNYMFIQGDVTELCLPHSVDVVIGGAVIQWIHDKQLLFKQLNSYLGDNGLVALSTFVPGHFSEIKVITDKSLTYPTLDSLAEQIHPYFEMSFAHTETKTCFFDSPLSILKHMQKTGVNAISKTDWTKSDLQHFIHAYEALKTSDGYPLTYKPLYIILQKKPFAL